MSAVRTWLALAAWIALATQAARADVYTYVAKDASTVLTNARPDRPGVTLLIREVGEGAARPETPDAAGQAGSTRFDAAIADAARAFALDVALLRAVISVESNYLPNAVSRKGAVGLMQLMPETGKRYGVLNLFDPVQNIRGGAQHLQYLLKKFDNQLGLALAAYNAGEHAVERHGGQIPPFPETTDYVDKVTARYAGFKSAATGGGQ